MKNIKEKINVALVGCGKISFKHLTAICELRKFLRIVALCDLEIDKLKENNKTINDLLIESRDSSNLIKLFKDYELLIKAIKTGIINIDLIVLCTPSGMHASQAIKAGKIGVNVCTEKPLATSLKDGLDIVECFDKSNANLFVVLQNRLNPAIRLLKKQIDNERFGKLFLITSNVMWQRPQEYYDQAAWRGTKKMDGGALLNQACHYADLMCYLPNQNIIKISSFGNTLNRKIEMEDTAVVNFEYEKGTLGNLSLTMLTFPKNFEGSITVLGEKGTVKIGGLGLNKIDTWLFDDKQKDDNLLEDVNNEIISSYSSGHLYFYKEIIKVINQGAHNSFSAEQGLLCLKLIMSAYDSITDNQITQLNTI